MLVLLDAMITKVATIGMEELIDTKAQLEK
jgi:hypothetical protein